jgi:RecB family endonuclease NucS
MSDIKLFRIAGNTAKEIQGTASHLEKPLQNLIEENLAPLLGIRFLASEYSTGKTHAGRIDTLGLDENDSPVIIEYKRRTTRTSSIKVCSISIGSWTIKPSSS